MRYLIHIPEYLYRVWDSLVPCRFCALFFLLWFCLALPINMFVLCVVSSIPTDGKRQTANGKRRTANGNQQSAIELVKRPTWSAQLSSSYSSPVTLIAGNVSAARYMGRTHLHLRVPDRRRQLTNLSDKLRSRTAANFQFSLFGTNALIGRRSGSHK